MYDILRMSIEIKLFRNANLAKKRNILSESMLIEEIFLLGYSFDL